MTTTYDYEIYFRVGNHRSLLAFSMGAVFKTAEEAVDVAQTLTSHSQTFPADSLEHVAIPKYHRNEICSSL